MTLKEYGINYKQIPHGFWLKFVKEYYADDYESWCFDEFRDPENSKTAFQYLWRPDDDNTDKSPYNHLIHVINTCLKNEEEVPQFISKLRRKGITEQEKKERIKFQIRLMNEIKKYETTSDPTYLSEEAVRCIKCCLISDIPVMAWGNIFEN